MSARTHTRVTPRRRGRSASALPWWALVLPALAFAVLFCLALDPADAHAATDGAGPGFLHVLAQLRQALPF
ncbi:hypothetical protein [Streptomyces sp. Da 82-17]|uniref:hypothetical protein n=1 Tax=Streptomyces sp. Da 82-17 TaxID=3377116 RepID=UPI0038D4060B